MNATVKHFAPHPQLLPYIEGYTFRNICLDSDETLEKLMPHRTISSIEFFLATPHQKFELKTKQTNTAETSTVRGFRTFSKYRIQIRDHFVSLTIKFRPSGMYGLLGIPLNHLTN